MNEFSMQIEPFSCCCCSSELGHSGDITLEGSVVNFGTGVVQIWHDWLVHGTIPLHISWLSVSISVHVLVVLMVDWVLSGLPLAVGIWDWWVLWKNTGQGPAHQVWVVSQSLGVEGVVIQHQWTVVSETTARASDDVVNDPEVGESATSIEVLDWELTNGEETKNNSELGSGGVVGEVEVRLVGWSGHFLHFSFWEPRVHLNYKIAHNDRHLVKCNNSEYLQL